MRKEAGMLGLLPEIRRARLSQLLNIKPIVRIMEAHSGLTGLIVEISQLPRKIELNDLTGCGFQAFATLSQKANQILNWLI